MTGARRNGHPLLGGPGLVPAETVGPAYSQAITVPSGVSLTFVSGQLPLDVSGDLITGTDVAEQTEIALSRAIEVLRVNHLSERDIVKVTVFVTDLEHYARINAAYLRVMKAARPTRSMVQVAGLPRGALAEVEVIAMGTTPSPQSVETHQAR